MKHIKDDCIFCKLANGDIPSNSIYEDEDFNVILDAAPAAKGHAIIIPKTHATNLFELPEDCAAKIMVVAKKCGKALMDTFECDGLNVLQNNGEAAGQTVFHLHVHLIPRFKDDDIDIKWKQKEAEDAGEVVENIKKHF